MTVLIVSAALVFLLLGFQFHSLTLPFLIFLAQPVSLASALFALWITGTPLNVSSFMGVILLIGLDVKNGIILIEYIGQLRGHGMPLHEALLKAGRTRFRPILMTSLCTILGLVPLATGPRARRTDAAAAGDRRHRRPDHQHALDPALDTGRLPGLREDPAFRLSSHLNPKIRPDRAARSAEKAAVASVVHFKKMKGSALIHRGASWKTLRECLVQPSRRST